MQIFDDFHQNRIGLAKINYGIITLIPKGDDANIIQKYKPICLLQVLFKIFTKALTVRSELYMKKIIHACQSAFIKGRFIANGIMLLQEILRDSKCRKQQGVILKIDFEKLMTRLIGTTCWIAADRKVLVKLG
jgi:hypothetical protein